MVHCFLVESNSLLLKSGSFFFLLFFLSASQMIYTRHVIVERPWYTRDVNPVKHFLPEKCVTRPSIFN